MTIIDVKVGQTLKCGSIEMKVVAVDEKKVTAIQEHKGASHVLTISAASFLNPHLRPIVIA
jgi:hypothetical protein